MKWKFKSKSSASAPGQVRTSNEPAGAATSTETAKDVNAAPTTGKQPAPASKDPISVPEDIADDSTDDEAVDEEEEESSATAAKGKEPILETYPICTVDGPASARTGMAPMAVFPKDNSHQLYYCDVNNAQFDMILRRGSPKASIAGSFKFERTAQGQSYILITHTDGTKSAFGRTKKAGKGLKYMCELKASPPSPVTGSHKCIWKLTFAYGVNKLTGSSSYKVMDMDEAIVYAAFIKELGSRKIGRIVVLNENVGERFLEQILLCALALNESKRRQTKRIRGSGGKLAGRMAARGIGGILGNVIASAI